MRDIANLAVLALISFAQEWRLVDVVGLSGGEAAEKAPQRNPLQGHDLTGGADRDRTGDPLVANQVLSQLSYRPEGHAR
jgi:hypothetical protein